MRILAVGAHPDDIELQCGGTLALYRQKGHEVFSAVLTDGDKGNFDILPDELRIIRREEFVHACEVLGSQPLWGGFSDELLDNTLETRLRVVDIIREANPDVVITHSDNDYHPDHRYTGQLTWDALPLAAVGSIQTEHPPITRPAALYLMDNFGGIDFHPTDFVDITGTFALKREALSKHASQLDIFQRLLGVDLYDVIETVAKFRGYHAGCGYAEGFKKVDAWYRGLTKRVLPASEDAGWMTFRVSQDGRGEAGQ